MSHRLLSVLASVCFAVGFVVGACDQHAPPTDMERWARSALKCPTGTLTWSALDCGAVDQLGNFTAPGCPTPYVDQSCHVQVTGCGASAQIQIDVVDDLRALSVYCAVVAPETCCRQPPVSVPAGGTAQFFAAFQYACAGHVLYNPLPPPPLCP